MTEIEKVESELIAYHALKESVEIYRAKLAECLDFAAKRGLSLYSLESADREIKRLAAKVDELQLKWEEHVRNTPDEFTQMLQGEV